MEPKKLTIIFTDGTMETHLTKKGDWVVVSEGVLYLSSAARGPDGCPTTQVAVPLCNIREWAMTTTPDE